MKDGIQLEECVDELQRRGFYACATRTKSGWVVTLECGVDVWPAQYPRPRACGATLMQALGRAKEMSLVKPE